MQTAMSDKAKQATGLKAALTKFGRIEISFPYDAGLIAWVKTLSGRRWHSADKKWTADLNIMNTDALHTKGASLDKKLTAWWQQQTYKPSVQINTDRLALYPFQRIGIEYIESHNGRALVADEQGLGKTVEALGWLRCRPDARPAVVACPASLKLNWEREAHRWCPDDSVQVVNGREQVNITASVVIVNYDILATTETREVNGQEKLVTVCRADIKAVQPKVIIIDESHSIKSAKTLRTAAVLDLCRNAPHVIALTGTPILNRPVEIFTTLKAVKPALFPSFWQFAQRYTAAAHNRFGWDFNGASNTEELHKKLTETVMIRRLKSEVLPDLPQKVRAHVPLEISNEKECLYAEKQFINWVTREFGKEKAERTAKAEALAQIEYLKQLCARGKLVAAIEWISNFLESGEKLVVMATHKEILSELTEKFGTIAVKIDGSTPGVARQEAVDRFQTDDKIRLFIGNIQAAGVGLTLTAASNLAFLELPWTPGALVQAEDRIHRIGQEAESVNIYYLLAASTMDEKIAAMLEAKAKVIGQVLDGQEAESESMLSAILENMQKTT